MNLSKEELNKVWLITGSCGQGASHFFDLLLEKGYTNIHGTMRRSATFNTQNIDHIFDKLKLHYADLTDPMNIHNIIAQVRPDYIVHFAAQSHVKVSHDVENYTFQTNTLGTLSILQSVRSLGLEHTCKIYHASTSEQYGNTTDGSFVLNENSPMNPVSIYGISKKASQEICNMYRDAYGMFIVSSVLFNHDGPRRGHTFVTQKICNYVAKYNNIKTSRMLSLSDHNNLQTLKPLQLGNLNARRDFGYAKDYIKAVYLMLQQENPQNYVIATGETHSVKEFVELAFKEIHVEIIWVGEGIDEVGVDKHTNKIVVEVNPRYFRDIDIECLIGDSSKAQKELGWKLETSFKELVNIMVNAAIQRLN